jgi:hypothetical protein
VPPGVNEAASGIVVNASGNAYVAGYTSSTDFPTATPWQPAYGGGFRDAFLAKISFTPREQIEALIDKVEALVTSGVLNQGQGNALIAKLEAAIQQLDHGNVNTAVNQLQAFINQVNGLMQAGVLPPAEGQPLLDCANQVIAALDG